MLEMDLPRTLDRIIRTVPLYLLIYTSLLRLAMSFIPRNHTHQLPDDVTIQNISKILDMLLDGYDYRIRPGLGGPPVTIDANMNIRSMGPISEVDMSYSMDCYFRQSWRDPRLQFSAPNLKEIQVHISILDRLWKPDTYFQNGRGSYVHMITTPNKLLRITQDGTILYSMRLTIKASCPMYLEYFPVDSQICPLIFSSYAYDKKNLRYNWDPLRTHAVEIYKAMTLSQFDLSDYPIQNFTVSTKRGEYSVLSVEFKLKRHMGYFLIQVYVPCILIVVLSWVSFWLNREAAADRIGLGITTVLTLTTLQMDTRQNLPKVAYATALDWFIIMCFAFIIATMFEFAAVHYFTKVGFEEVQSAHDSDEEGEDDEEDDMLEGNGGGEIFSNQNSVIHYSTAATPQNYNYNHVSLKQRHPAADPRTTLQQEAGLTGLTGLEGLEGEIPTNKKRSLIRDVLNCLGGNYKYRNLIRNSRRRSGPVNSVSIIDKVSRILFPLSFAMLNVAYWIAYTKADPRDNTSRVENIVLQQQS